MLKYFLIPSLVASIAQLSRAQLSPQQIVHFPPTDSPTYNVDDWPINVTITTDDVFCWQNGTAQNKTGVTFLRTTNNYFMSELWVHHGEKYAFEELLPYCGPFRPYTSYFGTRIARSKDPMPCYRDTDVTSAYVNVSSYTVDVSCWLEGGNYKANESTWWEHARLFEGEKCYVANDTIDHIISSDLVYPNPKGVVLGSGGECPDEHD
ncbi:hypothetical protein G7Y89_g11664 [Cudoniella acicularis]|uniref:Uncharacterized protein n=1 Tax=Cudoniella acicularis TaxID=354080 RepID=A0A8H4RAE8_9HELO|nr:hypothetical protein G7Y89_g11664 [Cudoniella acicularis]